MAITCVHNEGDIVEAFIRHTLAFVDHMVILDHDSTDDTNRIVTALQDEELPLLLQSDQTVGHWQGSRMTRLMREVAVRQCAADWVLPLDADEFIVESQAGALRQMLAASTGPRHVRWATYAPRCTDDPNDANPVTRIRFRVSEESTWYKVFVPRVLAEHERVTVAQGNHEVEIDGVPSIALPTSDVWLAHFPVRTSAQFAAKVSIKHLQYLAMHNRNPDWGYHIRRFYDLLKTDPERFHDSYCDAGLEYAPRETHPKPPAAIEEPLYYAGGPLRHTSPDQPPVLQTLLQYTERLAQSYADSSGELEGRRAEAEELARERRRLTEWETELRDRERQHCEASVRLQERVRSSDVAQASMTPERTNRVASAARTLWHPAACSIRDRLASARHQFRALRQVLKQFRQDRTAGDPKDHGGAARVLRH